MKTEPGYKPLGKILQMALDQAQHGKGKKCHGGGLPFLEQPILRINKAVGGGFCIGQGLKKAEESMILPDQAKIAELLGAIVYLAAEVIYTIDISDPLVKITPSPLVDDGGTSSTNRHYHQINTAGPGGHTQQLSRKDFLSGPYAWGARHATGDDGILEYRKMRDEALQENAYHDEIREKNTNNRNKTTSPGHGFSTKIRLAQEEMNKEARRIVDQQPLRKACPVNLSIRSFISADIIKKMQQGLPNAASQAKILRAYIEIGLYCASLNDVRIAPFKQKLHEDPRDYVERIKEACS